MYEKIIAALEKAHDLNVKQIRGSIVSEDGVCAIGVLYCEMLGMDTLYEMYNYTNGIPMNIIQEMQAKFLPDIDENNVGRALHHLTLLNDGFEYSFKQIADNLRKSDKR